MALAAFKFGVIFCVATLGPRRCQAQLGPAIEPILHAPGVGGSELRPSLSLTDPQDAVVARGRDATLRCAARSTLPGLRVAWLHQDRPLPPDDARRVVKADGSLYIAKVLPGKKNAGVTGNYTCLVSNKAGTLRSSVAKLRIASLDREILTVDNVEVNELQPAILQCYIHSVPTAEIQWKYNSQTLPQNSRYVPLATGALLITKTIPADAGTYKCIAKNSILNKTRSSKDITLSVQPKLSEAAKPNFLPLNLTLNVTKLVGEDVSLACAATGWPIPQVQWRKYNTADVIGNSTTLKLKNVRLKDAGNYTCTVSNSKGKISLTYNVQVYEKPSFNVTPISKSLPSAGLIRLDCQARGTPKPKIYWLKDGEVLQMDDRTRIIRTELVRSHSFSKDAGLYQCVAVNAAGRIWTAAQIEIRVSEAIQPPQNLKCRPYDDTSVCLTWESPIKNTSTQMAYSVYSSYIGDDKSTVISGPEYVTNYTYQMASNLRESTNYTFYVRMYIKQASERSKKATCQTGIEGSRNLDIIPITKTSVELKWSEISMDLPCNGNRDPFVVKWRKFGDLKTNVAKSYDTRHVISGLEPGADYQFRIVPETFSRDPDYEWVLFNLETKDENPSISSSGNATDDIPLAPEHLQGFASTPTSVKLNWSDISLNSKFYGVCYVDLAEKKECEEGKIIKTFANKITIADLKPNAQYEFRVRSHYSDVIFGPFSQSIEVQTPPDVPSKVTDLEYKVLNSSTICLKWQAPRKYGNLTRYVISYAPSQNWLPHMWFNITIPATPKDPCWKDETNVVSTMVADLDIKEAYSMMVTAENEVGEGDREILFSVSTNEERKVVENSADAKEQVLYHQKVGVIIGVILALFCIIVCVLCIVLRRRCLKRRAVTRTRLAASSNHYPAVAHYASHAGAVQVRLEDPCRADEHEIEHLVSEERTPQVSVTTAHLDTKGPDDFPNGHVNGISKFLGNGTSQLNGHVHITENPQYSNICNGTKPPQTPNPHFEEDSNSNVRPSKFYDLYRLFESSKRGNGNYNNYRECSENGKKTDESLDSSLNTTEMTCLDDTSFCGNNEIHHRRVSPIIGPNG